jgi:hypothetical protein
MGEIEIIRWSGIWLRDGRAKVGVRLSDGRDALLTAFWGSPEGDSSLVYSLIINGQDFDDEFIIPLDLEKELERRMVDCQPRVGSVSLKELRLF